MIHAEKGYTSGLDYVHDSRRLRWKARMYGMNSITNKSEIVLPNSLGCCPFCAGSSHINWVGLNPLLYGVTCRNCGASIRAIHPKKEDAIRAWNRRSGLASIGGRATRGNRSRRKLAAARRNLKTAREVRKLNRMRATVEAAYASIKPYRDQELTEMEAASAENRAWLKEREHLILADPRMRSMYELLEGHQKPTASGDPLQTDCSQCSLGNSVLQK